MKRIEDRPIIVSLVSGKGGVSKTTSTVNLAASLALDGFKTLIVDVDRQSHSTKALDRYDPKGQSVADVMLNKADPRTIIVETGIENLFVLPAAYEPLETAQDKILLDMNRGHTTRLRALEVLDEYSFILVDCPPDLGLLTTNALAVSDYVLVPVVADRWGIEGLVNITNKMDIIREEFNSKLTLLGVFLARENRTVVNREVKLDLEQAFGDRFFHTAIRQSAAIAKSSFTDKPVVCGNASEPVAHDYIELKNEFLQKIRK